MCFSPKVKDVSQEVVDAIVKLQMTKVKSPKIETGDSAQALLPQYSPLHVLNDSLRNAYFTLESSFTKELTYKM